MDAMKNVMGVHSKDVTDLGNATVDYLKDQVTTHHPELTGRQGIAIAGIAAISAGVSLLVAGNHVPRDVMERLLHTSLNASYAAVAKQRKH